MAFGETLSMDRYLEIDETNEEEVRRREQTRTLRKSLDELRAKMEKLKVQGKVRKRGGLPMSVGQAVNKVYSLLSFSTRCMMFTEPTSPADPRVFI
jgi:hypothetical protein